jgi:hypothetical protein
VKHEKKVEIKDQRIVLYTGVLVDEQIGHRIWLYFWLVYNKNLPILVFIFKNRIFFVKHNKILSILADFFWAGVFRPYGRSLALGLISAFFVAILARFPSSTLIFNI